MPISIRDIPVTTEEKYFSTYEEFGSWEKEIEKSTTASFIKTRVATVNKNGVEKNSSNVQSVWILYLRLMKILGWFLSCTYRIIT